MPSREKCSSRAMPTPPDCTTRPAAPGSGWRTREGGVQAQARHRHAEAVRADQAHPVLAAGRQQAGAPETPRPEVITTSDRTPRFPHSLATLDTGPAAPRPPPGRAPRAGRKPTAGTARPRSPPRAGSPRTARPAKPASRMLSRIVRPDGPPPPAGARPPRPTAEPATGRGWPRPPAAPGPPPRPDRGCPRPAPCRGGSAWSARSRRRHRRRAGSPASANTRSMGAFSGRVVAVKACTRRARPSDTRCSSSRVAIPRPCMSSATANAISARPGGPVSS